MTLSTPAADASVAGGSVQLCISLGSTTPTSVATVRTRCAPCATLRKETREASLISPCGLLAVLGPPPPASQTTREHEPAPLNTENGGPPPKAMPKPMKAEIEAGLRARSKTEAGIVAYPNLTEPQPSMGRTAPTAESTPPPATKAR